MEKITNVRRNNQEMSNMFFLYINLLTLIYTYFKLFL